MDSEHEHMHDDDVESLDSDGDSKLIDNNDTDDTDFHGIDSEITSQQEQNCTILNEEDVFRLQEEDITSISTVFIISKVSASILLQHYNWIVSKVQDAWCADEEKVCREVGLLKRPVIQIPNTVKKLDCGICFESYPRKKLNAAGCGHPFCRSCWISYISTSISDGPGCLMLRCPEPSCRAAVDQDMINMFASDEDKHKYSRYLLRSYIEKNPKIKWCPAPGCNYAVDFDVGSCRYDVSCKCSYRFCWNCTEEAHRPVDCSTVAKWILKNCSEAENTNWILANTKPCPKCKRPIEKNHGCMHMTCRPPCNLHFCWLCLVPYSDHHGSACNGYSKANPFDVSERNRELAKKSLQRYTHYYERWAANHLSREKAVADLKKMQSRRMKKLSDIYNQPETQLQFIKEAWLQVIECRRVLKWTYAYGYYLPEHEHSKKQLFEYLQGDAESGLERLHHCAEEELQGYLNSDVPSEDFREFRTKLIGLTKVTQNYFENLVQALENGLSDVKSQQGAYSKSGSSKNSGSSKKSGGTIGRDGRGKGISRSCGPWRLEQPVEERVVEQVEEDSDWFCAHCTYANRNNITTDCQMCNLPRYY